MLILRSFVFLVLILAGPCDLVAARVTCFTVQGNDGHRGAYAGHAILRHLASGVELERQVTYADPLPESDHLVVSWRGTATASGTGHEFRVELRRLGLVTRIGASARTARDAAPVIVLGKARFASPTLSGASLRFDVNFDGPAPSRPVETWTPTDGPLEPAPRENIRWRVFSPAGVENPLLGLLFLTYRARKDIASYATRPEFVSNELSVAVDRTARTWYRRSPERSVLLMNRVDDEHNLFEQTLRARAFASKMVEKMRAAQADMERLHLDETGMIAGAFEDDPQRRATSGDGALHQGIWVASQVYRYMVTGEAAALEHVRRGTGALVTLVEIVEDPTTFARAIQDARTAPADWPRGKGPYAGLAWMRGGNNDMLHGIEYGFLAASKVLPVDDPLRARMLRASRSLLEQCPVARRGTHVIFLAAVAAGLSGDPADLERYERALGWRTWIDRQWIAAGNGLMHVRGITDWSGHHLAAITFCALRLLRGIAPAPAPALDEPERTWREAGRFGTRNGWRRFFALREALLTVLAAAQREPGAVSEAKDILVEIVCPKAVAPPGMIVTLDRRVDPATCVSSCPTLPWKLDWLLHDGRVQVTTGVGYFQAGAWDNTFIRSPLAVASTFGPVRHPSQDFLHAYWLARLTHVLEEED